jgi:cyclopropane fatty-acyl-phospholipid synthase-like methyltransferase
MPDHASQIKSMKLYTHIERILNEVEALGKEPSAPLRADEISAFDQMHYHGTSAVDDALAWTGLGADSRVLEIGSGFGGPARHIASHSGAHVLALELQPDQDRLAAELTARCGLTSLVDHICGDVLTHEWNSQQFDAIVSWLAIFHIPDRDRLLAICRDILAPGGLYFAEDMYCRNPMAPDEREELASGMYAAYLPDLDAYKGDFSAAGFEVIRCDEMSDDWTAFTSQRLMEYRAQRERHIRVHGELTYLAMEEFYELVNRHFRSGKLGGIRILARKR